MVGGAEGKGQEGSGYRNSWFGPRRLLGAGFYIFLSYSISSISDLMSHYLFNKFFMETVLVEVKSLYTFFGNAILCDFSNSELMQEGKALKLLATAARLDIEDFLQKKVFLEVPTYVKLSCYPL